MPLQFKIQLKKITHPPVWRRIVVPEDMDFMEFHRVIQDAFGWENDHMFAFQPDEKDTDITIGGTPFGDPGTDMQTPGKVRLKRYFKKEKQKWRYIYDFGDWWLHTLTLEKIIPGDGAGADCLAGKGKCPPENCGGIWGYAALLQQLETSKETGIWPVYEWGIVLPKEWDANEFDLAAVREILKNY